MCSIPQPMLQSCDTGQRKLFFDSCQLITTWMSNTKFYTDNIKVCHFASANIKGWTYVRTHSVRTIFSKAKFLGSIDYHIFLPMVLAARELRLQQVKGQSGKATPSSVYTFEACTCVLFWVQVKLRWLLWYKFFLVVFTPAPNCSKAD